MNRKTQLDRVKDPSGRVDVLAFLCLERISKRHPVSAVVFEEFRKPIGDLIFQQLGPRNKTMRQVRRYVRQASRIVRAGRQR